MKMSEFHRVYDSIDEAVRSLSPEDWKGANFGAWAGGLRDQGHARQLAEKGWPEGVERARRMQMQMRDYLHTLGLDGLVATEEYDVSGADVDVGLFCEGEPECMVQYDEKVLPDSRVVRLIVQINYIASVDADSAMRRGVAIAAVADALELAGLQCEIWAVDWTMAHNALRSEYAPDYHRHAVLVKRAGEPMPIDRIAFAIGHPGFYRAISFALRKQIKGGSGGSSRSIPEGMREPGELVIPLLTPEQQRVYFESDTSAAEWAASTVGRLIETARSEVQ